MNIIEKDKGKNMKGIVNEVIDSNFDEISKIDFKLNQKTGLVIKYQNQKYEFIIKIVDNDKDIVVFCPELNDKEKEAYKNKAYFDKHVFNEDIEHNVIYFNDPTRYEFSELNCGCGIGNSKVWHLKNIANIIKKISERITDYESKFIKKYSNIYFYGSSLSGFMAIALSTLIKDSTSIAVEPYINLTSSMYYEDYKKTCFKDLTPEQINKQLERVNLIELIKKEKFVPNSYIKIDTTESEYWNKQYQYLFNELSNMPYEFSNNKINITFDGNFFKYKSYIDIELLNYIENIIHVQKRKESVNLVQLQMVKDFENKINSLYNEYTAKKITFKEFKENKNSYMNKWNYCRIDIKNFGNKDNDIEIMENKSDIYVDFPGWFKNNTGRGCMVISKDNNLKFKLKCKKDGILKFELRAVDFTDKDKQRKPIHVCYKNFKINNEIVTHKDFLSWHDKPYVYRRKCKDNEVLNIELEFETLPESYPYLNQLINYMDDEKEINETFESFKNYCKYLTTFIVF